MQWLCDVRVWQQAKTKLSRITKGTTSGLTIPTPDDYAALRLLPSLSRSRCDGVVWCGPYILSVETGPGIAMACYRHEIKISASSSVCQAWELPRHRRLEPSGGLEVQRACLLLGHSWTLLDFEISSRLMRSKNNFKSEHLLPTWQALMSQKVRANLIL